MTWAPLSPGAVAELFSGFGAPWWLAGGYAIEQAVGRPLRAHGDIDVLVLRPDLPAVQRVLAGWEWWGADPSKELRRWPPGAPLADEVHDIWCRPASDEPWRLQVMVDEVDGADWVSRRNARIRRPVATLDGGGPIPCLVPEIQLFYKAKAPRPKDEIDFQAVLPLLDQRQRAWLSAAMLDTYGDHPWRELLGGEELRA